MEFPVGPFVALCTLLALSIGGVRCILCPRAMTGLECCQCEWNGESDLPHIDAVICKDLGHLTHDALTSLKMAPHISRLEYTGNNIVELKANIFGNCSTVRFLNLTYIDLSSNGIEVIHGQSFHCVPNVQILKLNYNRWRVDPDRVRIFSSMPHLTELHLDNAFLTDAQSGASTINLRSVFNGSQMNSLQNLHLDQNSIQFIDRRTFCQLPNLVELHLSNNSLSKISLDCLDQLRDLYVKNNKIPWLTVDDIQNLEKLKYLSVLDLSGNPFQCTDCSERTKRFRDWLTDRSSRFVVDKPQLKCVGGKLSGRTVTSLSDEDLVGTCSKPAAKKKSSRARTTKVITGIILGIIGVLTIVFLYINRHDIQKGLSRWTKPIRNSVLMRRLHFGYTDMNNDNNASAAETI